MNPTPPIPRHEHPTELTLELPGGLTLAALAWGPEEGRPVLALHGWMDNAASFATLAPRLVAGEGAPRLVALDLPGHGRSGHRPPGVTYHFIDWVADVVEAADALGWARFAILGHSMGAGVGLLTAGALPERVERLVMLDGIGPMTTDAVGAPARLKSALTSERRKRGAARGPRIHGSIAEMVARRRLASGVSDEAARRLVERAAVAEGGGWRYRHDPRLRGSSRLRLTEGHVEAFAQAIRCPLLVVKASGSPAVPAGLVESRLRGVAATVEEVEGGHHVHLEAPERVAPLVRSALVADLDPAR